ncbi:monocyte chemotactic protein 1B-like isoform X2 [Scomber scombrus]|uniref:monocyte chemotactic protein 1B-like isoform X2 n=1 Tax=Scomber scombrus TaxID=13677 RepID=UPI002DD88293|nr:monocyte chemotactic protein 1B-like isoform X2 [Scomber scombrus]
MAPWGDGKLLFCVLFLTCCIETSAHMPTDCCVSTGRPTIVKQSVVDYRRLFKGQGCPIDAVMFVTRNGKKLCSVTDLPGLSDVMKHVDNLKKRCKDGTYKPRRCFGVNRV